MWIECGGGGRTEKEMCLNCRLGERTKRGGDVYSTHQTLIAARSFAEGQPEKHLNPHAEYILFGVHCPRQFGQPGTGVAAAEEGRNRRIFLVYVRTPLGCRVWNGKEHNSKNTIENINVWRFLEIVLSIILETLSKGLSRIQMIVHLHRPDCLVFVSTQP